MEPNVPMIEVRIDDLTTGGYKFKLTIQQKGKWFVVPRVGDTILDLNEFPYLVEKVTWYDPQFVRIEVRSNRYGK